MAKRQRFRVEVAADLVADLLAAPNGLGHRRRAEPQRRRDPGEDLGARVLVGRRGWRARQPAPRPPPPPRRAPRSSAARPRVAGRCRARAGRRGARRSGCTLLDRAARPPRFRPRCDVQQPQELQLDEHVRLRRARPPSGRRPASPRRAPSRLPGACRPRSARRRAPAAAPLAWTCRRRRADAARSSRPIAAGRSLRASARRPASSSRCDARAPSLRSSASAEPSSTRQRYACSRW